MNINRKTIEEYYNSEWKDKVSDKTLSALIELTCQVHRLNKPDSIEKNKQNTIKPHDLGKI